MARFLLLFIFLVGLAYGALSAGSSAEAYWRLVLPDSPMPSAIRDLIYSSKAAVPAASEDSVGSVFFLEKSLQPGSTMTLHFTHSAAGSLVPRQVADSIPFSSSKLPDILSRLSVDPNSEKAASIQKTLAECEAKASPGEVKRCATSLESMVEFAMSGLKSDKVRAMSTSVAKAATPKQTYTITGLNKAALALGASDAAAESSAESYWRSKLPYSPMPSAVRDLIYSGNAVHAVYKDRVGYICFLEKSLQPGSTMTVHFKRAITGASLLPPQVADSIPFSSSNLPEILSRLSIDPNSRMAAAFKKNLADCEADAFPGQIKHCATSLESMVDFAMYGLKSIDIRPFSTLVAKPETPKQEYTITGLNKVKTSEFVACHAQGYAYAVYHCHTTTASAYTVSLVGADGTKVQALAACHLDVASGVGSISYLVAASKKLGVEPGSAPICHFVPQEDILWARV